MELYVLTSGPVVYGVFSEEALAKAVGEGLMKDLKLSEVMIAQCWLDIPKI